VVLLDGEVELGAERLRLREVVEGALTSQERTTVCPWQVVEEKGRVQAVLLPLCWLRPLVAEAGLKVAGFVGQ